KKQAESIGLMFRKLDYEVTKHRKDPEKEAYQQTSQQQPQFPQPQLQTQSPSNPKSPHHKSLNP
ncbi:hypothetical protein ACJMK2_037763, partial [Sinanodonta woodiana]